MRRSIKGKCPYSDISEYRTLLFLRKSKKSTTLFGVRCLLCTVQTYARIPTRWAHIPFMCSISGGPEAAVSNPPATSGWADGQFCTLFCNVSSCKKSSFNLTASWCAIYTNRFQKYFIIQISRQPLTIPRV